MASYWGITQYSRDTLLRPLHKESDVLLSDLGGVVLVALPTVLEVEGVEEFLEVEKGRGYFRLGFRGEGS